MSFRLAWGVAVAFCFVVDAASATTSPNFVRNPGAEAGPASPDGGPAGTPLEWTASRGNAHAVVYGIFNHPSTEHAASIGGGANHFAGGPDMPVTELTQEFDATPYAAMIDSGKATLRLSGFVGGLGGQRDDASVTASMLDAAGTPTTTTTIGPVTDDRGGYTVLLPRATCVAVPAGVRRGRVTMVFVRGNGTGNNAYADNLSVSLSDAGCAGPGVTPLEPAVPPVPAVSGVADLVKGSVGIKLPGSGGFAPLADQSRLPVGSEVDATRGTLGVLTAQGTGGKTQSANFYDGQFVLTQPQDATFTDIRLSADVAKCPRGSSRGAGRRGRTTRRLWGNGTGLFRTRGRRANATVRGRAQWLTEDSCAGTLIRVTRGSLVVRDFRKKKNIRLRAPARYLAK